MNSGIYLFIDKEDKEICIFLFQQFSEQGIKELMPDHINIEGDHALAILRCNNDKVVYGKCHENGIRSFLNEMNAINLMVSYEEFKKGLDIPEDEFNRYQKYATERLSILYKFETNFGESKES
tara:strand:+ start:4936 stop:5304 length:369 start_codon:yes stop_codon:yes gene_type:complete